MRGAADQVKRLSLELGGHAPFIVFPDADPEVGAKIAVMGKFRNNGQVCIAPSRFYVHKDVEKKFTEAAVEFAKALKLGNGLDAGVEIGPMFEKRAMDNTLGLIDDARKRGAKILTGGKRSDRFAKGYFFEPTVLTGLSPDAKMLTEEPFAPVMPVLDFSKIDDVIRGGEQHALRPGGLRVHQRPDGGLEDGGGPGGRHHRHQRPGAGHAAVPLRRHEGERPGPRAGARGAGGVSGDEVRELQAAGLMDGCPGVDRVGPARCGKDTGYGDYLEADGDRRAAMVNGTRAG